MIRHLLNSFRHRHLINWTWQQFSNDIFRKLMLENICVQHTKFWIQWCINTKSIQHRERKCYSYTSVYKDLRILCNAFVQGILRVWTLSISLYYIIYTLAITSLKNRPIYVLKIKSLFGHLVWKCPMSDCHFKHCDFILVIYIPSVSDSFYTAPQSLHVVKLCAVWQRGEETALCL